MARGQHSRAASVKQRVPTPSYPVAFSVLRSLDPHAVAELRFAPPRRWRFDMALPTYLIAIEVEGGLFSGGRHTRGAGALADMEKYNAATVRGWRLLRFAPSQLKGSAWLAVVKEAIASSRVP